MFNRIINEAKDRGYLSILTVDEILDKYPLNTASRILMCIERRAYYECLNIAKAIFDAEYETLIAIIYVCCKEYGKGKRISFSDAWDLVQFNLCSDYQDGEYEDFFSIYGEKILRELADSRTSVEIAKIVSASIVTRVAV